MRIAWIAASVAALSIGGPAWAAPGDVDTSFGTSGRFTQAFGANNAQVTAAVVQPDRKIVLAGYAFQDGLNSDADFVVMRLLPGGTPDPDFGNAGTTITPVNLVANGNDFPGAVA